MGQRESVVLDIPADLRPPAPDTRADALRNRSPTRACHYLSQRLHRTAFRAARRHRVSIGRVAVVSDLAAIRCVLLEDCDNYEKGRLQRDALATGFAGGLLTAGGYNWCTPYSKTI